MAGRREVVCAEPTAKAQPEPPRRPTDGVFHDQFAPSERPITTEHTAR